MRERGAAHFDVGSALLASAAKPCQVGMARGGEGREAGSYCLGVLRMAAGGWQAGVQRAQRCSPEHSPAPNGVPRLWKRQGCLQP